MANDHKSTVRRSDLGKGNHLGRSGWCTYRCDFQPTDTCQLFLQFQGPTNILIQTRASRISDVLTSRDVNEIADAQPGVIQPLVNLDRGSAEESVQQQHAAPVTIKAPRMQTASIGSDGKVTFEPTSGY